jgi:hypothetical protein
MAFTPANYLVNFRVFRRKHALELRLQESIHSALWYHVGVCTSRLNGIQSCACGRPRSDPAYFIQGRHIFHQTRAEPFQNFFLPSQSGRFVGIIVLHL